MVEPEPSELARDVAKGDNWLVATSHQEFDRLLNNVFAKRPYAPKAVLSYLADHAIRNSTKSAKIFAEMQNERSASHRSAAKYYRACLDRLGRP